MINQDGSHDEHTADNKVEINFETYVMQMIPEFTRKEMICPKLGIANYFQDQ